MKYQKIYSSILLLGMLGLLCLHAAAEDRFPDKATLHYAKGFTLEYYDTHKVITVLTPWKDAGTTFQYILVPRGEPTPAGYEDEQRIDIPVRTVVTMSTSYLPYLAYLDVLDALKGHDNFKHINTPEVLELVQTGKLQEIGEGPNVNVELLLLMHPDLIMTHANNDMYDTHPKLYEAQLSVVINASYLEEHPLGRVEWIKCIAAFFNEEAQAEAVFSRIADDYERLAAMTRTVQQQPTVFVNAPYNGNWWTPGGKGYLAAFLRDAGARYLWAETESSGSTPRDFEAVYERAADADFWLNPSRWNSLADGLKADERFAQFKAFQQGKVFNNNARVNEHGGNDYWESGLANPDVLLADLIKIFHPELLPDHELVYYQQLK